MNFRTGNQTFRSSTTFITKVIRYYATQYRDYYSVSNQVQVITSSAGRKHDICCRPSIPGLCSELAIWRPTVPRVGHTPESIHTCNYFSAIGKMLRPYLVFSDGSWENEFSRIQFDSDATWCRVLTKTGWDVLGYGLVITYQRSVICCDIILFSVSAPGKTSSHGYSPTVTPPDVEFLVKLGEMSLVTA